MAGLWDAPVLVGSTYWVCFIHTGGHAEGMGPGMKLAAHDLKKKRKKHDGVAPPVSRRSSSLKKCCLNPLDRGPIRVRV